MSFDAEQRRRHGQVRATWDMLTEEDAQPSPPMTDEEREALYATPLGAGLKAAIEAAKEAGEW